MKLKTEERRELIRLDEHKALLCVEISRLQRAVREIEEKLREQDSFTLLRVSPTSTDPHGKQRPIWKPLRGTVSQLEVTKPRKAELSNTNRIYFQALS